MKFKKVTRVLAIVLAMVMPCSTVSASSTERCVFPETVTWPRDQQLPTFSKARHLDVADIYDEPGDVKLLMATMQGIVNRKQPRIYLLENEEEGRKTWLNDLKVPYVTHKNYWNIVKKYKHEIKGMVIYDPDVPDSINVATTLAGIKDAVVVSPELADQLQKWPYRLHIVDDLRGRFKDKMDAYTWQYENLWSQTTHRMLVGLSPDTSIKIPGGIPDSFTTIDADTTGERDSKNRQIYTYDLSSYLGDESVYLRFDDAFPEDGWGPAVHEVTVEADGQVIARFVPGTEEEEPFIHDRQESQVSDEQGGHRFADNGRYFVYKFNPPEGTDNLTVSIDMWNQFKLSAGSVEPLSADTKEPFGYLRDYAVANKAMVFWLDSNVPEQLELFEKILSDVDSGTPYLGWFDNDVAGEFSSVEVVSKHGVYVLAADWFTNLTVFSGTRPKNYTQQKIKTPELDNKIYVTYTFSEGDNLQYNQHRMRNLWDDPNRGKVPINWTSSPLLYDAAPAMLNYYQKTATANDQLIAGPSGGGYLYPDAWPIETFPDFLEKTYPYLSKTGMTVPYILNRIQSKDVPLSDEKAAAYEKYYDPKGLFLSWENDSKVEILNDSLPVSTMAGISSVKDGQTVLEKAKENWDGSSPLFISLGILAWNMTPSDLVTLTESLGDEYETVLADQYFSLIREANSLPKK